MGRTRRIDQYIIIIDNKPWDFSDLSKKSKFIIFFIYFYSFFEQKYFNFDIVIPDLFCRP